MTPSTSQKHLQISQLACYSVMLHNIKTGTSKSLENVRNILIATK